MHPELLSLSLFMLGTSCSPGPNNIVASYSGFNFGVVKTFPHMLGVIFGFTAMVNPKGVIVGIIIVSTYVESGNNFINYSFWVILVSFTCALISITFWTFVGKFFRRFATNEKFIKIFNYAMASLLLACIGTFYL